MQSIIGKSMLSAAIGMSLFAAGCASNEDLDRVRSDLTAARQGADQALAAAQAGVTHRLEDARLVGVAGRQQPIHGAFHGRGGERQRRLEVAVSRQGHRDPV